MADLSSILQSEAFFASVAAVVKATMSSGLGTVPLPPRDPSHAFPSKPSEALEVKQWGGGESNPYLQDLFPLPQDTQLVIELSVCNIQRDLAQKRFGPSPPRQQQVHQKPIKV